MCFSKTGDLFGGFVSLLENHIKYGSSVLHRIDLCRHLQCAFVWYSMGLKRLEGTSRFWPPTNRTGQYCSEWQGF